MKPVLVLVGRPNVGKSTLFNALTRTRDALVADVPGLTRDRQYGDGRVGGRPYLVVDTGGLAPADDELKRMSQAQTRQAMIEADVLVLVLDARTGLHPEDREIAAELRRLGRATMVAVNKTEGLDPATALAEFHALGLGAPMAIAAAHGRGLEALIAQALAPLPPAAEDAPSDDEGVPRIAIIGRPNVGKSTLTNQLLGEERMLVSDIAGTTRDSIRVPFRRGEKSYVLIDTAGVRRASRVHDALEKYSVIKTLQSIDDANVAILMLDATQEVSEQDASLAGYVLEQGRGLVLAVNKWDGIDTHQRDWIKREVERKLPFLTLARPHFISARLGTNIASLIDAVDRAYASARRVLPTPKLMRVLARALAATPPPMLKGRRINFKLAHQGGKNPPLIVLHGNQVQKTPDAYRRYLENAFRRAFKLEGTPIRLELKEGENPFVAARTRPKVTPRVQREQQRSRRIAAKRRERTPKPPR